MNRRDVLLLPVVLLVLLLIGLGLLLLQWWRVEPGGPRPAAVQPEPPVVMPVEPEVIVAPPAPPAPVSAPAATVFPEQTEGPPEPLPDPLEPIQLRYGYDDGMRLRYDGLLVLRLSTMVNAPAERAVQQLVERLDTGDRIHADEADQQLADGGRPVLDLLGKPGVSRSARVQAVIDTLTERLDAPAYAAPIVPEHFMLRSEMATAQFRECWTAQHLNGSGSLVRIELKTERLQIRVRHCHRKDWEWKLSKSEVPPPDGRTEVEFDDWTRPYLLTLHQDLSYVLDKASNRIFDYEDHGQSWPTIQLPAIRTPTRYELPTEPVRVGDTWARMHEHEFAGRLFRTTVCLRLDRFAYRGRHRCARISWTEMEMDEAADHCRETATRSSRGSGEFWLDLDRGLIVHVRMNDASEPTARRPFYAESRLALEFNLHSVTHAY